MRLHSERSAWALVIASITVELLAHRLAVELKMPYRAFVVVVLGSLGIFTVGMGIFILRSIVLQQVPDGLLYPYGRGSSTGEDAGILDKPKSGVPSISSS